MYKLTDDPQCVIRIEDSARIPIGHRWWFEYEQWLADGGVPSPLPVDAPVTIDQARIECLAAATAERWLRETGGIELGGVRVGTTLDDQNRISGVLAAIALGGLDSVDFKAASGWVRLTADDLQGIAQAISAHVQACFSAERAHHEAIAALETLENVSAYDVMTGWPA